MTISNIPLTFPALSLYGEDVEITALYPDAYLGKVWIGVSDGRVLLLDNIQTNAFMSGDRRMYGQIMDGMGCESELVSTPVQFQLENVVAIVESDGTTTTHSISVPVSASLYEKAYATFTTPPLWAHDLLEWGNAVWSAVTAGDSEAKLFVRYAESELALTSAPWVYVGVSGTCSLSVVPNTTNYLQAKIELSSVAKTQLPWVSSLVISYRGAHSIYFFTTKIVLEETASPSAIVLCANQTVPVNTKIEYGITDTNSAEWTDYTIISKEKLQEINPALSGRIKVGIKLVSYDTTHYPVVDEFAVMFRDSVDTSINR